MNKSNLVFAVLCTLSPVATQADQILFEFIGLDGTSPAGDDAWTMQGQVLIDEVHIVPGVNLVPFFDSWEFSWTNGVDTYSSSSVDSIFLSETPVSGIPITFFVDAAGSVESSFLCSDACTFETGHPEFNIGYLDDSGHWQGSIPIPGIPGFYTFVTGHSATYINRGPIPEIVKIEIRPGSEFSRINLRSKGMIPVSVLTTNVAYGDSSDFDATQVDPATLMFGPDNAVIAHSQGHLDDIDGDGDIDLVVHFRVQETGISCDDTEAALTGETFAGNSINGTGVFQTVGCK